MLHIYPACLMYTLQSAVVIVLNAIVIMKLGVIVVENAIYKEFLDLAKHLFCWV